MKNSLTKERRKGAGKKRVFAALFSFLLVCMIFISAAIPAAAAPDETDAYLQQYLFDTKNFYHTRKFSHQYSNSNNTVGIASNYSEKTNKTDVVVIFPSSSLGSKYSGHYVAKCGTCIDGEEMCYINPSLYGANIGVVSVWLQIPNDSNEVPVNIQFDPRSVNFYFSSAYEDWFYYGGKCNIDGSLYFVYYKFFYTTEKNKKYAYHNIAAEFNSSFNLPNFSVYTGLEYFNITVDHENLTGSLHDYMRAGWEYGCLKRPPSVHLTEAEEAYLLGLNASDETQGIYNDAYDRGYNQGHGVGYDSGRMEGYVSGFQTGQEAGFSSGEKFGYDKGYNEGYEKGCFDADPNTTIGNLKNNINSSIDHMSDMLNEKVDGANTAIGDDDGNAVFAFFNGTWNGIADFYDVVTSGVSVNGVTVASLISTLLCLGFTLFCLKYFL